MEYQKCSLNMKENGKGQSCHGRKTKGKQQKANNMMVCLQKNTSIIIVNSNDIVTSKDKAYLNGF